MVFLFNFSLTSCGQSWALWGVLDVTSWPFLWNLELIFGCMNVHLGTFQPGVWIFWEAAQGGRAWICPWLESLAGAVSTELNLWCWACPCTQWGFWAPWGALGSADGKWDGNNEREQRFSFCQLCVKPRVTCCAQWVPTFLFYSKTSPNLFWAQNSFPHPQGQCGSSSLCVGFSPSLCLHSRGTLELSEGNK